MRPLSVSLFRQVAGLAALLAVAGCTATRSADTTGSLPDDYRNRHPIQITRGIASIDVLPGGGPGGLTDRQVGDIQFFVADWQKRGRGKLLVQAPVGAATDVQSARGVKEIRRVIAAMGISDRGVEVLRYEASGPAHLAPVRLQFPVLEARLPHACGQWPDDAGYSDPGSSNRNESPWNFGCASQQNLAAQVEDPEDFIRPRAEDAPSAARRARVIDAYRRGQDSASSGSINSAVDTQ